MWTDITHKFLYKIGWFCFGIGIINMLTGFDAGFMITIGLLHFMTSLLLERIEGIKK